MIRYDDIKEARWENEMPLFWAFFIQIVLPKLGQATAEDNKVKLMMKHAPEWVRTTNPVIWIAPSYTSDLIILSVNFSCELGQVRTL